MDIENLIFKHIYRQLELRNSVCAMELKAEREKKQEKKYRLQRGSIFGLSVAVCLVIFLFVSTWRDATDTLFINNIERPTLADYRAASSSTAKIEEAMEHEDYESALKIIDETLAASTQALAQFAQSAEIDDEALIYEKDIETVYNYQLRWMHIYVLVSLNRKEEAIKCLRLYVTKKGEHQEEAKMLLNALNKR